MKLDKKRVDKLKEFAKRDKLVAKASDDGTVFYYENEEHAEKIKRRKERKENRRNARKSDRIESRKTARKEARNNG